MPLAPPMTAPAGPATPVAPATGNPGLAAAAMAKAREAISILEQILPDLPTGSEPYNAVLDSLKKLTKALPAAGAVPGVQKTALQGLAQRAQSDAMMQAVMRSMGGGGGGGAPGGAPGGPPQAPTPQPQPAPMGPM